MFVIMWNMASYSKGLDRVRMPNKERFDSNGEYYCTLFHELTHSTAHDTRVGRDMGKSFGDDDYSNEELIAEIGACFICSSVGIEQTFDNSAAYIKGWLKKLKDDKKLIVKAASQAKKAAEYILDTQKEKATDKVDEKEKATA